MQAVAQQNNELQAAQSKAKQEKKRHKPNL